MEIIRYVVHVDLEIGLAVSIGIAFHGHIGMMFHKMKLSSLVMESLCANQLELLIAGTLFGIDGRHNSCSRSKSRYHIAARPFAIAGREINKYIEVSASSERVLAGTANEIVITLISIEIVPTGIPKHDVRAGAAMN